MGIVIPVRIIIDTLKDKHTNINRFDFTCNFLIFLIDHFVQFSISHELKTLVVNIWELIFDERRGPEALSFY